MTYQRRRSDRRSGVDRRGGLWGPATFGRIRTPPWAQQRSQFITRYLFSALSLAYFNFGSSFPPGDAALLVMNVALVIHLVLVSVTMWHARRHLWSPTRWRLAMVFDLAGAFIATLVDPLLVSPAYVVYMLIILGNGMRYGARLFAEGLVLASVLIAIAVTVRFQEFRNILSLGAAFFPLFGAVMMLYLYALTVDIDEMKQQLEHERNIDELTGLLNRRALYERAQALFSSLAAGSEPMSLLFADVDGFKSVNDTLGHHAGDRVLSDVARVISRNVREVDLVGRVGGDEFILLLPNTDRARAAQVADRLQGALECWSRTARVDLSLSIGIGEAPSHGRDLESLIQRVDQAMYEGRSRGGRGSVRHVDQDTPARPA